MYQKDAYHQYQMSGLGGVNDTFEIIYTKADGSVGTKNNVKKRISVNLPEKADLSSIKNENRRAGKWFLWEPTKGAFEIHACGIIAFNGQYLDHRF
jgi:altronate dehydratase